MGNMASTKKIELIEKAYNRIKEYLIDSLLQTAEGRKIVFQTQYSMDEQQVESNGVVINLVQQKDPRDN